MGNFGLIEQLKAMVETGEIILKEGKEEGLLRLRQIAELLETHYQQEVVSDIMAPDTAFYAPEYPDWRHFLDDADGREDYGKILYQKFTEEELENLWQNSHISEDLKPEDIQEDLVRQIGQLKMLSLLERIGRQPCDPKKLERMTQGIRARIVGLYNILYE